MEPTFYKEHQMNNNIQDQCLSCLLCTDCRNNIFTSLLRRLVQSVGQIQSVTQVVKTSPENVP